MMLEGTLYTIGGKKRPSISPNYIPCDPHRDLPVRYKDTIVAEVLWEHSATNRILGLLYEMKSMPHS